MKIDIVDATKEHFKDLSKNMREVDVQECKLRGKT